MAQRRMKTRLRLSAQAPIHRAVGKICFDYQKAERSHGAMEPLPFPAQRKAYFSYRPVNVAKRQRRSLGFQSFRACVVVSPLKGGDTTRHRFSLVSRSQNDTTTQRHKPKNEVETVNLWCSLRRPPYANHSCGLMNQLGGHQRSDRTVNV